MTGKGKIKSGFIREWSRCHRGQRPIAANTAQLIRPTFRQTLLKEKKEQNYSSSKIG